MAGYVFISYSRRNRDYVERLATHLRTAGVPVWFDHDVAIGDHFDRIIRDKIDSCSAFVVVMSADAEDSDWVNRELARADAKRRPTLPLLLNGEVFFRLGNVNYDDVTNGELPDAKFVARLRELVDPGAPRSESRPRPTPEPPPDSYPRVRRRPGEDVVVVHQLELAKMAFGSIEEIDVSSARQCSVCFGSGGLAGTSTRDCLACLRHGVVPSGRPGELPIECERCGGYGNLFLIPCLACAGAGRLPTTRTLKVRIRPGIAAGARIKLSGHGNAGRGGGSAGDLLIEVNQLPHSIFTRKGDDLYRDLPVAAQELARGGPIAVGTLDGQVRIRLPAGSRPGQKMRIRSRGVPHKGGVGRGDLIVTLTAAAPRS